MKRSRSVAAARPPGPRARNASSSSLALMSRCTTWTASTPRRGQLVEVGAEVRDAGVVDRRSRVAHRDREAVALGVDELEGGDAALELGRPAPRPDRGRRAWRAPTHVRRRRSRRAAVRVARPAKRPRAAGRRLRSPDRVARATRAVSGELVQRRLGTDHETGHPERRDSRPVEALEGVLGEHLGGFARGRGQCRRMPGLHDVPRQSRDRPPPAGIVVEDDLGRAAAHGQATTSQPLERRGDRPRGRRRSTGRCKPPSP